MNLDNTIKTKKNTVSSWLNEESYFWIFICRTRGASFFPNGKKTNIFFLSVRYNIGKTEFFR